MEKKGFVDVTFIEEQNNADSEQNTTWFSAQLEKFKKKEFVANVAERGHDGGHEYLVKCKNVKQCWHSATDLKKSPQLIEAFEKQKCQKSAARDEDEVARDGTKHHDGEDDNEANQNMDNDYTGTRQVPSSKRRPLQNRGITANSAKSDALLCSSSRHHRPTKHLVEGTNVAVKRRKTTRRTSPRNDDDEPEEYAVEKVLKKRVRGARVQYYVKWEGYDSSYNSWEPRDGLKHLDIVKEFEKEQSA